MVMLRLDSLYKRETTVNLSLNGSLSAGSGQAVARVCCDKEIKGICFSRAIAGTSGTTKIDINKNGTTIFTTQDNRPSIAASDGDFYGLSCTLPDVVSLSQGDILSLDIDEIEDGSPSSISAQIWF